MANIHIAALHDRVDEAHFELRLHASAIDALQRRVNLLEAAVSELRTETFGAQAGKQLPRHQAAEVSPLRHADARSRGRAHAPRLA